MPDHSLAELAALTGLPARTIRYYVAQALIPSPGREGPATRYPETTLARLRLIASLRDAHLPLAAIRTRLGSLTDDEVLELAASPLPEPPAPGSALEYVRALLGGGPAELRPSAAMEPPSARQLAVEDLDVPSFMRLTARMESSPASQPQKPSPATPERSTWERIALAPDIELHVRRPLNRRDNRLVERLIAFARQLQGEDKP